MSKPLKNITTMYQHREVVRYTVWDYLGCVLFAAAIAVPFVIYLW